MTLGPVSFAARRKVAVGKRWDAGCALAWGLASPAFAAPAAPIEVEVVEDADPFDPAQGTGARTVVDVDSLPPSADVADAVDQAPGATVRRLGGLASWSAVSVRGSTTRQVEVFLDGLPLNPDGAATVDLSELPLRAFERVEVYRSGAPLGLGSMAMGGVVNLVSRQGPVLAAGVAGGSYATARGHGLVGQALGRGGDLFLAVDGVHTRGDFTYYDDAGTRFTPGDDRLGTRGNNDKRQVSAHLRWRVGDDHLRLTVFDALLAREEGVPGYAWDPATETRYRVARSLPAVALEGGEGPWRAGLLGWGQVRREQLDDPLAEIGVGADATDDRTTQLGSRATFGWAPDRAVTLAGALEARRDRYRAGGEDDPMRGRTVLRGSAGVDLLPAAGLTVAPAIGAVWLGGEGPAGGDRVAATPRLGLGFAPSEGVAVSANVESGLRPPDLTELYGDRGALVGNPELRPERGVRLDLGLRGRTGAGGPVTARGELGGFGSWSTDRIVYVQNAQLVAVPVNLDRTRTLGLEASAGVEAWGWLGLSANGARLISTNLSEDPAYAGNQLPRVPGWELQQRATGRIGALTLGYRFDFVDADYWDATNWYRSAPRLFHGASAALADPADRIGVELEVLNLADHLVEQVPRNPLVGPEPRVPQAITDFAGYPLPGRTFLLSLRWSR